MCIVIILWHKCSRVAAYREVHCKSQHKESEFFHSRQEFDTHRHRLHLDKFLENQSFAEDSVFLGQFEMWRKVPQPGWQEQHFHLDNANVLYSDSKVGRRLNRARFQVQPNVQYCCRVCCMQCGWAVVEVLAQYLYGKIDYWNFHLSLHARSREGFML